ncbi:MAG: hypothetical protein Q7K45_05245 [Nanoarchaeota archaeon]|nr:hypothetical protein [Nanoarchaeota archaeon]
MFEPKTPFQHKINPNRHYSGAELRQLVLDSFPAGEQAEPPQGPLRQVPFQGLAFVTNSIIGRTSGFGENYANTQYHSGSREEILERLILDKYYGSGEWISITEMPPAGSNSGISLTFDYIKHAEHYALRK